MRLTVIGCSGSFPGPDSPASCYLIEAPYEGGIYRLLLDLGSGAVGTLQRFVDLRDVDAIALSHLHADHCHDLCGFYVVSKYHPDGPLERIPVLSPSGTSEYLSSAYGLDDPAGMTEQFDFRPWKPGDTARLGPFDVRAALVDHPVEAYAIRIEAGGDVLVYSGDTGPTEVLTDLLEGAHTFLCEASFVESRDNPANLHLTGAQAGSYATRAGVAQLLVTHIPVWTDRLEVESDVTSTWDGPYELVTTGSVYDIGGSS